MNNEKQLSTSVKNAALSGGLTITTMDDLARIGSMLQKSNYFEDAKDASQAGVKVLAGLELGVPVMAAMAGINIIKGKPVMSANLMAACVKRHEKYDYKVLEHTDTICKIAFLQDGKEIGVSEFSFEDAKKAGITAGTNWQKYPKNMLFARAMSNGVKWYASDIFLGAPVYTEDELMDVPKKIESTPPEKAAEQPSGVIDVEIESRAEWPKTNAVEESTAAKAMREAKEKYAAENKAKAANKVQCEVAIGENERCENMLSDAEVKFCNTTASKKMLCFIHQSDSK